MVPGERGLAGLGLRHRQAVGLHELPQRLRRLRVVHAAARDEQGPFRAADRFERRAQLPGVGPRPPRAPEARLEEALRPFVGLRLHVLAQGQGDRPAFGGIGHRGEGAGEGGEELFGAGDAVEVAAHRPEAVVRAHRAVPEVLDLLEHRIGGAVREHVARQQQEREPVHVRGGGGGHQVRGAGADGGGHGHRAPPVRRLGEGDGGMGHALLVVAAPRRQAIAGDLERFAETGHVAVAEDGPYAGDEGNPRLGLLRREIADESL